MAVRVLSDGWGSVQMPLFVDPSPQLITYLVDHLDDGCSTGIFATGDTFKTAFDDFYTAAQAADYVADGTLTIHVLEESTENTFLIGEDTVSAVIYTGDFVTVTTDDTELVDQVQTYRDRFNDAPRYDISVPSLSTIEETLAEEMDEDIANEYINAVKHADTVAGVADAVRIALVIAAKHQVQQYQISKWGEYTGIASRATFSRTKNQLEDDDIIKTEKIPQNVGRPRLRLALTENTAPETVLKRD